MIPENMKTSGSLKVPVNSFNLSKTDALGLGCHLKESVFNKMGNLDDWGMRVKNPLFLTKSTLNEMSKIQVCVINVKKRC